MGGGGWAGWLWVRGGGARGGVGVGGGGAERAEGDLAGARAERDARGARGEALTDENSGLVQRITVLEGEAQREAALHRAELEKARAVMVEQLKAVEGRERQLREEIAATREQMKQAFGEMSAQTVRAASADFLKLAETKLGAQQQAGAAEIEKRKAAVEQLVKPIGEALAKTDAKLGQIEKERAESFGKLAEGLAGMGRAGDLLREETGKLVRALREPHVRGRYGELQLKRVAELAGMSAYCDFSEQDQTVGEDGAALKPDMIVRMPSDRVVVVDAKTNIRGYLDALEARDDSEREACLDRFARHVGEQATALARKKYWTQYDGSPEFVVMFIPGDQFIDAALSRQPEILENAARQNVLLAGPATLIGLLRAVAVGYTEQRLAEAAAELRELGVKLHSQMATALGYLEGLGADLNKAVERYNSFVGSYQSRLEPTLKKFEDAGVKGAKELPEIVPVDVQTRPLQGPRLMAE